MTGSRNPWARKVVAAVTEAGWRVEEGTNHTLLYPPDGGRPLPMARTKGRSQSGRGFKNFEASLRRKGVDI